MGRFLRSAAIQAKVAVGPAHDEYEREADRVADQVMRMPAAAAMPAPRSSPSEAVQRKCACDTASGEPCQCVAAATTLQRSPVSSASVASAPASVMEVLRSPGQPLDRPTRSFMEGRFGRDLSAVRVHTDGAAAASARSIDAHAYTVGSDVVFGTNQYRPATDAGRWLLAHELTHVIQQEGQGAAALQRFACNAGVLTDPRCGDAQGSGHPGGTHLERFDLEKDELKPAHLAAIAAFKRSWDAGGGKDAVDVDGYASCDGEANANVQLSCRRAEAVKAELITRGITTTISTFAHGETDEFGASLPDNRRAIISAVARPTPTPPRPIPPSPGPTPFPPIIKFWFHAFIPNTVSGARPAPGGPFAGRTVFPSPPHPFHRNSCFETDERTFSAVPAASSRVRVEARLDTVASTLTFSSAADLTFEIDCTTGASKCVKLPTPSTTVLLLPTFVSSSGVNDIVLNTTANDPCVFGSPDLAIRGIVTIDRTARTFTFGGTTTLYPAFEMYADFGAGSVTIFKQAPVVDSPFALLAPGLNPVSESVAF